MAGGGQTAEEHGSTGYAVVASSDMDESMQQEAVDCVAFAFESERSHDDIAEIIKVEFDTLHKPTWHCAVGTGMGSYVTHQSKCYIFMFWGPVGVLLWRTSR